MKKTICFFLKLCLSGILAVIILSAFCLVYYNPPIAVANPDKFTNNKAQAYYHWADMTEGFGYGKINNLGFNSPEDVEYTDRVIAVLGSSHTQAYQVSQSKSYVSLFNDKMPEEIKVINLASAGHFFRITASNFRYFAEAFENVDHAFIETHTLEFSLKELEGILNEDYHRDMGARGTIYNLAQKIPYLRLIVKQYQDIGSENEAVEASDNTEIDYVAYEEALDKVMKKLSDIAEENDIKLSILYHSWIKINDDCSASRNDDSTAVDIFKKVCEANGIGVVDVVDSFIENYYENRELPYGFANTTIGSGHLNETGHRIIADELYRYVSEVK